MIDGKVQGQSWFIEQEGKGELQKGTLKQLRGKGNSSQERCGSYKSWIEKPSQA